MNPSFALNLHQTSIFRLVVTIAALLGWVIASGTASISMLQNLYEGWQLNRSESLTVYLPPDTEPSAITQLQQSLSPLAGVKASHTIGQNELKQWLAPVLPNPEGLPLPTLVEVTITPKADKPALLAHIRQTFPTAEVDDHQMLLEQVQGTVRSLQGAAMALAGTMLALMALLVVLAVRTGLNAQRSTLQLLVTLGATDGFLAGMVTRQVALRVLGGTTIGTGASVILLAVGGLLHPALSTCITPVTWGVMVIMPMLLPLLATLTANLSTRRLLLAGMRS